MKQNIQIQNLRAISVLLVVFFHLDIDLFVFGFLGVDIFLVISGYLMHSKYASFQNKKDFANFWIKRFSRLFPAFVVVNSAFLLYFWMFLLPFERKKVLEQYFLSSTYLSNFFFWSQDQYFSKTELRPFLHTWSLSVEMQFYFLYPFVALLFLKKRGAFYAITGFSLFSFLSLSHISSSTSFFLLPFRLWEFFLGILVASLQKPQRELPPIYGKLLLFGTLPLVIGLTFTNISSSNPIPNLVIVLLASCCLYFSQSLIPTTHIDTVLSRLGDRSYVVYLIHLPLLLAFSYTPFAGNVLKINSYQNLFLYFLLLWIFTEFVHRKVENATWLSATKISRKVFVGLVAPIIVTMSLNNPTALNLQTDRKSIAVSQSQSDRTDFRCGLLFRVEVLQSLKIIKPFCRIATGSKHPTVLLIGNSHADSIKESVANVLKEAQGTLFLAQENMNIDKRNVNQVLNVVAETKPDIIILHSSPGSYDFTYLKSFLREVNLRSKAKVLLLGPVPVYNSSVPKFLLKSSSNFSSLGLSYFEEKYANEVQLLKSFTDDSRVFFMSTLDIFCDKFCMIATNSFKPFYFDNNHLTITGARLIEDELEKFINIHLSSRIDTTG